MAAGLGILTCLDLRKSWAIAIEILHRVRYRIVALPGDSNNEYFAQSPNCEAQNAYCAKDLRSEFFSDQMSMTAMGHCLQ